jgi:hypothetical protein
MDDIDNAYHEDVLASPLTGGYFDIVSARQGQVVLRAKNSGCVVTLSGDFRAFHKSLEQSTPMEPFMVSTLIGLHARGCDSTETVHVEPTASDEATVSGEAKP